MWLRVLGFEVALMKTLVVVICILCTGCAASFALYPPWSSGTVPQIGPITAAPEPTPTPDSGPNQLLIQYLLEQAMRAQPTPAPTPTPTPETPDILIVPLPRLDCETLEPSPRPRRYPAPPRKKKEAEPCPVPSR